MTLTLTDLAPADDQTASTEATGLRLVGSGPGSGVDLAEEATGPTKFWPALYGTYSDASMTSLPSTTTIDPVVVGESSGEFAFPPVPLAKSYRLMASKEGFESQAFVVRANADGSPLELDITLVPGDATIGGRVFGPDGNGLGGVELRITDGDLEFQATSSTDPDNVGTWSVAGLSTPATYTVIATRLGLATSVQQVRLANGQDNTGVTIRMQRGVGTVSGRVLGADNKPLGGIQVLVTAGEFTRSATTATEGLKGLYDVPALPLGSSYVVAVSAPGYLPQAREVTLSSTSINADATFTLTASTGSITGRVRSIGDGDPEWLPNASVTVTGKDTASQTLTDSDTAGRTRFVARKISATSGDPGAFLVDDLPPGEYLVTFVHYQHKPFSKVVNVKAGKASDMKRVDLEFDTTQQEVALFDLPVAVFEVTEGNGRAALDGWTVEYDNVVKVDEPPFDGEFPAAATTTTSSSETIPLPIGTYDLTFRRKNYRDLPVRGVTVGTTNETLTVVMLKLGEVNGYVYDASVPPIEPAAIDAYDRLKGYEVEIFDTLDKKVRQTISVDESATSPLFQSVNDVAEGEGLDAGPYQLRILGRDNPKGYYVDAKQILRRHETVGAPTVFEKPNMAFEIATDSDDPIGPLLVKAYRYPEVTVQLELLTDGTRPAPTVDVHLTCAGTATLDVTLTGVTTGTTTTFGFKAMDKLFLGTSRLADCVVTAEVASDYLGTSTSTFPMSVDIDGGSDTDRTITLWLVQDDLLGGTVAWDDVGTGLPEVYADGQGTISRDEAVVGFTTQPNGTQVPVTSPPVTLDLGSVSDPDDGSWLFGAGEVQVWDRTTYTVSDGSFEDGSFDIVIDAAGTRIENVSPTLDVQLVAKNQIEITTLEPDPVTIAGSYQVVSTTPDLTTVDPTASAGAFTGTIDLLTGTGSAAQIARNQSFRVIGCPAPRVCATGAAPGTWTVDIPTPTGHRIVGGVDVSVTDTVAPGDAPLTIPTATYVELAQATLTVTEPFRPTASQPVAPTDAWPAGEAPTVVVERVTTSNSSPLIGDLPEIAGYTVAESDGTAVIVDLAVDPDDPLGADAAGTPVAAQTATYRLQIADDDDHRFAEADVTINGDPVTVTNGWVTFDAHPGEALDIDIDFHRLGTLTGSALGYINGNSSPLVAAELIVTYDAVVGGVAAGDPSTVVTTDGADFAIAAPAGCYLVTVAHPDYEARATLEIPTAPIGTCPLVGADQSYLLEQHTDTDFDVPFGFDAKRASITFTVLSGDDLLDGPVDNATITVDPPIAPVPTPPLGDPTYSYQDTTTSTGILTTGDVLWPGKNRVSVVTVSRTPPVLPETEFATTNFPVILEIDVPFGGDSRDVTIYAVPVGGTIDATGQIVAENIGLRSIDLPPAAGSTGPDPTSITVTRSFNGALPAVVTAGGSTSTVVNTADELDLPAGYQPAGSNPVVPIAGTPSTSGSLTFDELPRGTHMLTFPVMPGYSPDAAFNRSVTVGITGTASLDAPVVYTAKNVGVSVTVKSDKGTPGNTADDPVVTNATVMLEAPLPGPSGFATGVEMTGGTGGVYTLANVMPELREYRLTVTVPRHGTTSSLVRIVPQATGSQTFPPVLVSRAKIEIRGSVVRLDSTGGQILAAPGDATVTLINQVTNATITGPVNLRNDDTWSFDVPIGEYIVRSQASGYRAATANVSVTSGTIALDDPVDVPALQLNKRLSFTFVVTAASGGGVNGATVAFGGQSVLTSGGSATIVVDAGATMTWTVSKPADGFGPKTDVATTGDPTIDVVLEPSIRGGVVTVNGTGTSGISVYRCASSVAVDACDGSTDVEPATSSTTGGAYAFLAPPGTWHLSAIDSSGNRATGVITVLVDGATDIGAGPTLSIAAAPTGLAVTPGGTGTTASASWSNAAGNTTQWRCSTTATVPVGSDCAPGGDFVDAAGSPLVLDDLVPGTTYTFEVRSTRGSSVSITTSTPFTTSAVPPPTTVVLGSATSTGLTATWVTSPGVTYEARLYPTGPASGTFDAVGAGSEVFSGLTASTDYTVEVRATITTASGTYTSTSVTADGTTLA